MVLLAGMLSSCAVHSYDIPTGPWAPAPGTEAAAAWQSATDECPRILALRASLRLSGRVGPQSIPGIRSATLGVAVTAQDDVGLEARHSGQVLFRLGGTAERTVLFWAEGPRTLAAPAADLVDALIGVRVTPKQLLAILAGCAAVSGTPESVERADQELRASTSEGHVFLARVSGAWRVRAARFAGLQISYDLSGPGPGPSAIRIDSAPGAEAAVALSLRLVDVERNPTPALPAATFSVSVPAGALPMTLDELRSWRGGGAVR